MRRALGALALVVLGCADSSPPARPRTVYGGPSGAIGWSAPLGKSDPVPGVDDGAVYAVGTALVIWGDATRGAGGGQGSIGNQAATGDGYLDTHDRGKVEFRFSITPARTGRVTVDGTDYDLANGNLFLVSTRGKPTRIKQLRRELSGMDLEPVYFQALGEKDPEIRAFFKGGPLESEEVDGAKK